MGLAGMAPQGMAPVQGQVTGISYPAPRGVAPGGFLPNILQQQQAAMSVMGNVQTSQQGPGPGQPSQRAFSGTVTKLHDNFGFVDDDVFFQTSVCKGQVPRVNDRVLVEAAFNPNMPFKWNATRVQVITGPGSGGPGGGQGGPQQNQQQGGGPGGPGGPQGGRLRGPGGPGGMGGPGGNFQGTNQLGSAFGGDGPHQGGPGGPRGGPDRGGPGGPERASRFDRGMGDMRGGPGGGGPGNMRGGDDSRGGGNDMRGGPMMRGNDMGGGNRGPHGDMGGPRGGDMRGPDMRGGDMRGPDLRGGGAEARGGDAGGPNMRGGHSADRRNNDRPNRSPPRRARPDRAERDQGNDRDREKRNDGEREKDSTARSSRKRSRSPSRRSRSPVRRSKSRSRSPPRRRARTTPRYNVSVPKISLNFPRSSVMELKKRYHNLYIPSDFFNAHHSWNEAFPTEAPFKVQYATSFNTFSKDLVDPPSGLGPSRWQFDPPDCDYTWVAKVMLLSSPNIDGLYEKTCNLVDSGSREREDLVHPTRALKFLVGLKEKREVMAIGGPWSPSLDGPNPSSDPSTLIKTAIRTCGALTGIDLSGCTQWTKFLQIHYRRQASSSKPARTETVVIFFPDVWSVMPNKLEYDSLVEQYSVACKAKQEGAVKEVVEEVETIIEDEEVVEEAEAEVAGVAEPAKWNTLDPKNMKVGELRDQLAARGQLNKGLKSQLTARLQKCLKAEQEKDEEAGTSGEADEGKEKEGEKSKEDAESAEEVTVVLDERKKEKIASAYKTPSNPCIFVHPNIKAKSGKFDCRTETLSVLLDYRSEDNKEGTFEVSLFAELFNEMLIRDSAFKLYSAIQAAPERPKEEKKEKKEEKEKKDKDKEEKKDDKEGETSTKEGEGEATAAPGEEEKAEEKREASVEMVEEKEKVMVTKNKDLLLGASYFDLSHCGYIETKDLEDILVPLQLDLSRAEIKKLASKLATKDQVNYRLLTDGEKDVEETPNPSNPDMDLASLARGFKKFLPSAEPIEGNDSSLVTFRGTVIDVEKLQEKLDKSEKVRAATDSKLIELQKKFSSLKETNERGEKSREKLSGELKDVKKKARGLEDDLSAQNKEATKYLNALSDVYSKVMPIVKPPKATEVKGTETLPQVNGVNKGADDEDEMEDAPANEEVSK